MGTMTRQSLLEYFQPVSRPESEPAVVWRRGYRTARWSYGDLFRAAWQFSRELELEGVAKGDRVLLWGENCGEWIAAFVGCLFRGAVVVPMDAIADRSFACRVAEQGRVRLAVIGRGLPSLDHAIRAVPLEEMGKAKARAADDFRPAEAVLGDPVEIVFTSGTTAEPRGVVLTHGNLLASIEPLEMEIERYRRYENLFHPLRILDLPPLSHIFGQLMGIFLPQILGATSVFWDTLNPAEVARAIRGERVSVLVAVPRLAGSLKDHLERELAASDRPGKFQEDLEAAEGERFWWRAWRFRKIHRRFGWRFWAIISGGAALPASTETFWTRLGYAVIQGYGLTETTSLVSVNHPFRLGRGSIGKTLPGLEMRLAEDGEILVRGENVAREYWKNSGAASALDEDGWFHTGDIGERDSEGNLYFKGRRKNVIVTPEGLNVYPEDLEAEVRKERGVRDCAVVGVSLDGNAEPCAVLLLGPSSHDAETEAAEIVHGANQRLAPHQRIRRWMVWHDKDFPRTSTQKPALSQIREAAEANWVDKSGAGFATSASGPLRDLLSRISGGRVTGGDAAGRLDLSSIERVELLGALEDRYQVDLSEIEFTQAETVGDLERLLGQPAAREPIYHYPRWAQRWPVRVLRAAAFHLLARPAMLLLGWPRIRGREHMRGMKGPVLVIANHVTFFDPAYVLQALPGRLRRKLAVAMDGELLESFRTPPEGTGFLAGVARRAAYWLLVSLFNVFPLPLHAGFRRSFAFAGDLADRGWSVLVFPEGARTRDGEMGPFRPGIGLLAERLGIPVAPVRLDGLFELKAAGKRWARPGQIAVSIGPPRKFGDADAAEDFARRLERSVAALEGLPS